MMVRKCTSTHYILFWTVVVPASNSKDLFMERVTMFYCTITQVLVMYYFG
jgi:hypothetical protein